MIEKLILDACCGPRLFWFDKNDKNTIYIDKRTVDNEIYWSEKNRVRTIDVHPDIIADFTKLPFPNESFYHVVFDPPHFVRAGKQSYMKSKYGNLDKNWSETLRKGFSECWRVLKVHGTLVFKWNATQVSVNKVIDAIGKTPLYGAKCGKTNKTHWLVFFKEK